MEQIALNKNNERVRRLRARRRAGILAIVSVEITNDTALAMERLELCKFPATRTQIGEIISKALPKLLISVENCAIKMSNETHYT